MAQAQVDRWATLNPTVRHSGKILEGFGSYVLPRLAGIMAVSGIVWYANRTVGWIDKPVTVTPEFMAEVKKIGPVAQRMNGPPVYLNPFHNRIPGSVRGPEDLKKDL